MEKPIINIDDLEYSEFGKGDKFHAARAAVSPQIGGGKLGYAVIKLQPGKRAWPYHSHHLIEEAFFVLDGEGTLRHADGELTYIAISTMDQADVMMYPDSGKYGVFYGPDGTPFHKDSFVVFARKDTAVDYWDGESED